MERQNKLSGWIKNLKSRGFGFIETKAGIDYFFHHSEYQGDFKELVKTWINMGEGKKVMVEFVNDSAAPSGPRALSVKYTDVVES